RYASNPDSRRHGWHVAGCEADLPVPSLGRLRGRSSALKSKAAEDSRTPRRSGATVKSMDRTSIIVIVVCFVLLGLWSYVLVPKLYPPKPLPPGLTNAPITSVTLTNPPTTSAIAPPVLEAVAAAPKQPINTNVPEQLLEVKTDKARYTFTS